MKSSCSAHRFWSARTYDTAKQLLRSGTAVNANYGSAQNARSHDEFTAKIGQVVDDASESRGWLETLRDTALVPPDGPALSLWQEADKLTRIFAKSYATAKAKQAERRRNKRRPMNR